MQEKRSNSDALQKYKNISIFFSTNKTTKKTLFWSQNIIIDKKLLIVLVKIKATQYCTHIPTILTIYCSFGNNQLLFLILLHIIKIPLPLNDR